MFATYSYLFYLHNNIINERKESINRAVGNGAYSSKLHQCSCLSGSSVLQTPWKVPCPDSFRLGRAIWLIMANGLWVEMLLGQGNELSKQEFLVLLLTCHFDCGHMRWKKQPDCWPTTGKTEPWKFSWAPRRLYVRNKLVLYYTTGTVWLIPADNLAYTCHYIRISALISQTWNCLLDSPNA